MTDTSSVQTAPGGSYPIAGRRLARVGYGAMQLQRLADDADAAASVLRHALDSGIDHLDTADFYGAGFVNEAIRTVTAGRDDVFVATKVGATPDPNGPRPLRPAQRPEELKASVEDNLRGLGAERLDLVYLRRLEGGPGLRAEGDQDVPLDEQLDAMIALRDQGKIGAIGLSGIALQTLRTAIPAGIAAVQNAYSSVDREFEEMLRLTAAQHIAWVPFFPLGSGFPGYPKVTDQPAVKDAAARLGATPSQVGLAWLLQHSANTLLIPGTTSIAHLDENVAAGRLRLDAEAIDAIDTLEVIGGGGVRWSEND